MVRSGTRRNLPLYLIGGILVMLFGIPLGFGGFGVLLGLLAALAGTLAAYFAFTASLFLTGALITLVGLIRFLFPAFWDRLIDLGLIQMSAPLGDLFDRLSPSDGGLLMILCGSTLLVAAWGMFRLGKHLLRGLRFLFSLTFDWVRRFARGVRRKLRREDSGSSRFSTLSWVTGK
jgi:hypothetical protein